MIWNIYANIYNRVILDIVFVVVFFNQKLTGQELVYAEFLGKPFISSYKYAEHCLYQSSGSSPGQIKSLYAVG